LSGNSPVNSSVRLRSKRHQGLIGIAAVGATGLTNNLTQNLQQDLYSRLFEGFVNPSHVTPSPPVTAERSLPADLVAAPTYATEAEPSATVLVEPYVRNVALLPGESTSLHFTPDEGLVLAPLDVGRLLVLTNQRLIAFEQHEGMAETVIMPVEEVKGVEVKEGARSKGTMLQGALLMVGAVAFYVLISYWLTGKIDGPTVPIIRMDLVAFIVFLAVLIGVGLTAQIYFGKPDDEVTFQGDGVRLTFRFKGESSKKDVFEVVNTAFAARQTMVAKVGLRDSRADWSGLDAD